jgi:hypothetical protein
MQIGTASGLRNRAFASSNLARGTITWLVQWIERMTTDHDIGVRISYRVLRNYFSI